MCPLTSLKMITRTAGCNMVISGWVWSIVKDFHFFRKELGLGSPKKDEHDQSHGISGGRACKNVGSTICY